MRKGQVTPYTLYFLMPATVLLGLLSFVQSFHQQPSAPDTGVTQIVVAQEELEECVASLASVFIGPVVDGEVVELTLNGLPAQTVVCVAT